MAIIAKAASVRSAWRRSGPIRKRLGVLTHRTGQWTNEEAVAYRRRLEAWTGSLGPRNDVERYLVERAVSLSWQIDQADRPQHSATPAEVGEERDTSEQMLRYQLACGRVLLRTLDALTRMRLAGDSDGPSSERGELQVRTGSRRRVGGYPVPIDPAPTVACADRIPVRLRRARAAEAAASAS